MSRLGIRHHLTTAYHPQSNGMVERTHRQLKDALRIRLTGDNWLSHIRYVLLSLHISSAELVYGASILLPGQLQQGPEPPTVSFKVADSSTLWWIPTRLPPSSSGSSLLAKNLAGANFIYICQSGISKPLTPAYSRCMRCWRGLRSPSKLTSVTALLTASSRTWDLPLFCLPPYPGEGGPFYQQRALAASHLGWDSVAELL